ncbi:MULTISPECIES: 4'-phosphopantetheinyl transferase superfamily protein [Glaesserella]|uniref:4'-phosphopantetheinyl transferase n=1 Tax=Glaesserella australis TaxID=2094024 RepID=A0A328C3L2_9PAST|nr:MULTISPECIES: 4'-phosphopantetheinyl transferase superfamily protein [Glaesserella]AUI66820.1 4'-phosphopantetheinyl transferase [Glaesserella sp. 15-184]RAL19872.1 4'-phosphopantetheinyl transferase [Glaesserella australis]
MESDRLSIIFAHHNEPIPADFFDYSKPKNKAENELSERQIKKWKSRRMAYFLLHQLFEKFNLDKSLLNNIEKTASGRPYIHHPNIDFNISHSGDWVAIIFSYHNPKKVVGIDIEHPQKVRRFQALLDYYAGEQELTEIQNPTILPELHSLADRFYLTWCLREAILKSQGVGIVKLSEVTHSLSEQKLTSTYCPKGILHFYAQLPFYLAYFFEQSESMVLLPHLQQWKNNQLIEIKNLTPIIYQVN